MPSRDIAAAVLLAAAAALAAWGGPLDPPPGPIAPTHKTLTEIEPRTPINAANTPGNDASTFRITAPGSYYLTGNIDGEPGKRGIEVAADNITIDLNGFTMTGAAGEAGSAAAIGVDILTSTSGVTVTNGTITNWQGGVLLAGFGGAHCTVTRLTIRNSQLGIQVPGRSSVRECTVDDSGSKAESVAGIAADCCSTIESCRVHTGPAGAPDAIWVFSNCVVRNCEVQGLFGTGIRGATSDNLIEGCTVSNLGAGLEVHTRNVVRNCVISAGSEAAALSVLGADNHIERNTLRSSGTGLLVSGAGNFILANTAIGNVISYNIATGNIGLFKRAASGTAFAGDTGGLSPGTTDANTNYSH